jgi:hypothetical protein
VTVSEWADGMLDGAETEDELEFKRRRTEISSRRDLYNDLSHSIGLS